MTRIAIAILVTAVALVTLIILAGRMNWYAVSYRLTSDAIDAVSDDESAARVDLANFPTFSDPAAWNQDFMRGARTTTACPTDTVDNIQMRMAAIGPYTVDAFERTVASGVGTDVESTRNGPAYNRVSELVKRSILSADRIYVFGFSSGTRSGGSGRVSGYFVTREDCLVHVEVTGFGN